MADTVPRGDCRKVADRFLTLPREIVEIRVLAR